MAIREAIHDRLCTIGFEVKLPSACSFIVDGLVFCAAGC
jgi:hypothetical protein